MSTSLLYHGFGVRGYLKEELNAIWEQDDRPAAHAMLLDWVACARASGIRILLAITCGRNLITEIAGLCQDSAGNHGPPGGGDCVAGSIEYSQSRLGARQRIGEIHGADDSRSSAASASTVSLTLATGR
jgi:N-acyl-L-homoserine lactone synthetase